MVYVNVPEKNRLSSFYLAMEEYIARQILIADDYFFIWQVPPTVMFGRNQLINNEVNIPYCQANNIHMLRRKSGGGCIYVDEGHLLFSYITQDKNVDFVFNKYIDRIVAMLNKLDIDAKKGGRNDILIDNRKISGNAFYHVPARNIVHGTMIYDTNMQNMVASITPSETKLTSKGVESVRQHIAMLKDYTTVTLEEFKIFAKNNLCSAEIMLTADDVKGIEEIEQDYLADHFIYGNNPRCSIIRKRHIESVGEIEVHIELKNNQIKDINIMGDFFLIGDINRILKSLRNVHYTTEAVTAALPEYIDNIIRNLKKQQLVELIME